MSTQQRVATALGKDYDPKADYTVVRPAMVGLPKYANHVKVGEFVEDGRDGGILVVLRRPAPPPKPAPAPPKAATAAERVRSIIASHRPPTKR